MGRKTLTQSITRSTRTVHTSAKAHTDDPVRHQNLIICSLAHCQPPLKFSRKSVWQCLRKVANKQTNNDDYMTSMYVYLDAEELLMQVSELVDARTAADRRQTVVDGTDRRRRRGCLDPQSCTAAERL